MYVLNLQAVVPLSSSENPSDFEEIRKYKLSFTMAVCKKIDFKAYIKNVFVSKIILYNYILN